MPLSCLQIKCLPCRCANYFVEAPCFLASHHIIILLLSAKFMLICIMCYCFCTCTCCLYVVYTGAADKSGRPGDHRTNVLTADPSFAGKKHAYRLHRSVSTRTSWSGRKRELWRLENEQILSVVATVTFLAGDAWNPI